jgi:hypothetical protein
MFEGCVLPYRLALRQLLSLCVGIVMKPIPDTLGATDMKVLNRVSIRVLRTKFLIKDVKVIPTGTGPKEPQEVGSPRISRHSAHESGKVVSPTHRPPLPPGDSPGIRFC